MGLKQGAIFSCFLFNVFMGAILEEIRKRLLADQPEGTFPEVRFNFTCNPLERNSKSRQGGGTVITIDILFADDSVFYVILNNCEEASIRIQRTVQKIDEVMKAFGQKVNAPKTEVMVVARRVEDVRKFTNDLIITLGDKNLQIVDQFKYVGSIVASDCTNMKEIAMRRGKMEGNYRTHMDNMFVKKRLDIVYMITMFKVFIVSTGSYNSSAWSASTKELMLLNSTARSILMRIFGFKWFHHVSYDFILKLCRLMGCRMYPMHLYIKMQRLCFFGHILRMDDNCLLKKLLFGEFVGGKRPTGRPVPAWIDRVKEDLVDFGLDPKDWESIKTLALDRCKWRLAIKSTGVEQAYQQWLVDNNIRRAVRMVNNGVVPISPTVDSTSIDTTNKSVRSMIKYLEKTPIARIPSKTLNNITLKLGPERALEIMEVTSRVNEGLKNRVLDDYDPWEPSFITKLRDACIESDKLEAVRDDIQSERQLWFENSDIHFDNEEEFEIEGISEYRKNGRKDEYLITWKPRRLSAHDDYPEVFPELMGKPWPITDADWIGTNSGYFAYIKKHFNTEMTQLKTDHKQRGSQRDLDEPVQQ